MIVKLLTPSPNNILKVGKLMNIANHETCAIDSVGSCNSMCIKVANNTLDPYYLTLNGKLIGRFPQSVIKIMGEGRINPTTLKHYSMGLLAIYNEDGTLQNGPQKELLKKILGEEDYSLL